jgi:hypothetical protein
MSTSNSGKSGFSHCKKWGQVSYMTFNPIPFYNVCTGLKELSYKIDFKNVDENGQILALTRAAAGFEFFRCTSDFWLK